MLKNHFQPWFFFSLCLDSHDNSRTKNCINKFVLVLKCLYFLRGELIRFWAPNLKVKKWKIIQRKSLQLVDGDISQGGMLRVQENFQTKTFRPKFYWAILSYWKSFTYCNIFINEIESDYVNNRLISPSTFGNFITATSTNNKKNIIFLRL